MLYFKALSNRQSREDQMRNISKRLAFALIAAFLATFATPGLAQEQKFKAVSVKTPDGLTISAQDWGNPNGPEILFIHGFSQSHLSWIKQVTNSDLVKEFHMVTYDLRGHGNSDKPLEPERYKTSKYWADEVQAVMDATGLKRPVLAGWSYAGRVMADYLTVHGLTKLAGLNYVDAGQQADPSFFGRSWNNLDTSALWSLGAQRTVYASINQSALSKRASWTLCPIITFERTLRKIG
jgi:non-heme chloroperoxidase